MKTKKTIGLGLASVLIILLVATAVYVLTVPAVNADTPQAHKFVTHPADPLTPDAYQELANSVGWTDYAQGAIYKSEQIRFQQWLFDHDEAIYDLPTVEKYLNELVQKLELKAEHNERYHWEWFPLKGAAPFYSQGEPTIGISSDLKVVDVGGDPAYFAQGMRRYRFGYNRHIPESILRLAADIKADWPSAEFDVSAIDRSVDPFVAVRFEWGRAVIGHWDESGFRALTP